MTNQYWLPKTLAVLVIFGLVFAAVWEIVPEAREMIRLAGANDGEFSQATLDDPLASELATSQRLIGQQKFAEAEAVLRRAVDDYPKAPRPRFLLGYTLHVQKKYDAALTSYRQAVEFPQTQALAHYNIACIYSIRGKVDQAIKELDLAIAAGFGNMDYLASDPDFDNIRADARFQKLLPKQTDDDKLFVEPTRIIRSFVGEAAGDQFGWTARRVGDWDQDGVVDFVATAPTFGGGRGKVYVYSSRSGKLLFEKLGATGEQFGNSSVGCGDVNGDGAVDLVVGAPNNNAAGNVYVFSGKDGAVLHHFSGSNAGDRFGYEVAAVGDIDGDNRPDILVGAAAANGKQLNSGKVFIYSGASGKLILTLEGERTGDFFGNAAACVDNQRGDKTLAIGANNAGEGRRGRVYVYRIRDAKAELAFTIDGDENSVNLGQMFISFPGDLNADGLLDIYASDFGDKTAAPGGGKVMVCSGLDGKELLVITGKRAGEGLGTSPSDAGDVNGDGIGDLIVGAWQNDTAAPSGGKVYLYDGKSGELIRAWTCREDGDTFGFDACGIGDVDGDGAIDFLLTSAWSNVRGPKTGRVFILAGGAEVAESNVTSEPAGE